MGLRLYQAPVESDIQSKPGAEKGPAQSRTSIRRIRSNRVLDQVRERRRRVYAATAASYNGLGPRRGSTTFEPPVLSPGTIDSNGATAGSEQGRRALRDVASRMGILDERVVAMFGERWAHLHAESNPSPRRDDSSDTSPMLTMAVDAEFLPRSRPHPEPYSYTLSNIRSTQAPNHPSRSATPSSAFIPPRRRADGGLRDRSRPAFFDGTADEYQPRDRASSRRRTPALEATRLDGLGDRNRSLSPEVWDTLQSTLTPDPQPPSVGSSFASASASAAASQSTAVGSSRTSFTTPDTAEESTFEPPCESGCDNSDTEGDEDDEMDHIDIPSFGLRAAARRSYADAARSNNEDPLELLGGIGGMQRIVRNLARREDIPDEWWAEVGLSRTLSREASEN
ncbi:hypothetical protein MMYC01_209113 [Madurella mycetomatis]|uniref:Uncharacterized protein n=1 Tax=Madurella mycetomatis TaxID=100816 RepID=A0A175VQM4_9PEZI|nr:hypothetical protein MMYC01_209113 [Madurella mycetomatis]